jgi:hypothetical protein
LELKFNILILTLLLFISCEKSERNVDYPKSNIANFDLENNKEDYLINVSRLKNGEYQIIYRDTLISDIDSTLHSKILDLKNKNRRIHEYASVELELDKNITYNEFRNLTSEFRKVFYQKYILKTDGNGYFRIQMLPYYQNDTEYFDDRIKGLGPPHTLYEELKPYFTENKILYITIKDGKLKMIDNNGDDVPNYKEYALTNKRFITLYDIKDDQTYEDFVLLYSQIIEWQLELKSVIEKGNKESEEMDEYKFMIVEKTHHNNGYN